MVSMRFKIKMDIPVTESAKVLGDEYCLRFRKKDESITDVRFYFRSYKCTAENGFYLNCVANRLCTVGSVTIRGFMKLLKECEVVWGYFDVVHNIKGTEYNNLLMVSDISIIDGETSFRLPDFVFPWSIIELPQDQLDTIARMMRDSINFCANHKFLSACNRISMYENNGEIYLCNDKGIGYCYNINSEKITALGFNETTSGLALVKQLVTDAVQNIAEHVSIPVKSLTLPLGAVTSGYFSPSGKELGSYNIVLK